MNIDYPIPPNEEERLKILRETKILDSSQSDADYDRYTSLCLRAFHCTSANIIFIETNKIFVKSRFSRDNTPIQYINRSDSIASHYLFPHSPDVFVIPNVHDEPRFRHHSSLRSYLNIQFLAGAAIIVEGVKLGFLVITHETCRYDFNMQQQMNLLDFAAAVACLISERRRSLVNIETIRQLKQKIYSLQAQSPINVSTALTYAQSFEIMEENHKTIEISKISDPRQDDLELVERTLLESGIGVNPNTSKSNSSDSLVEEFQYDDFQHDDDNDYDDDSNSSSNDNSDSMHDKRVKEILLSMGNCVRCNIFEIIAQSQSLIQTMIPSASNRITWIIDRTYLDYCQHICYPDVILYVLTSSISYLSTIWENLYLRIGFKKSHTQRNHKRSLHRNKSKPGIMEGRLAIEVHFSSLTQSPIIPNDSLSHINFPVTMGIDINNSNNNSNPFSPMMVCSSSSHQDISDHRNRYFYFDTYKTIENGDEKILNTSESNQFFPNKMCYGYPKSTITDNVRLDMDMMDRTLLNSNLFAIKFFGLDEVLRDVSGSSRYSEFYETSHGNRIDMIVDDSIVHGLSSVTPKSMNTDISSDSGLHSNSNSNSNFIISSKNQSSLNDKFEFNDLSKIKDRCYDYSIPCLISIPSDTFDNQTISSDSKKSTKGNSMRYKNVELKALLITTSKISWIYNLNEYMKSQGNKVIICYLAEEGLELLKFEKFDIAFIDVSMQVSVTEVPLIEVYHIWTLQPKPTPIINTNMLVIGITNNDTVEMASITADQLAITGSMHYYFPNPTVNMDMLLWILSVCRKYRRVVDICVAIDRKINKTMKTKTTTTVPIIRSTAISSMSVSGVISRDSLFENIIGVHKES